MKNSLVLTIIVALLVGVGGFFAGIQYQKSQRPNFGQFGNQRVGRMMGQNGNFRPIRGEILNADEKSITVKMQDGSSKIVLLSDKTSITEATSAGKQALQVGKQVVVFGSDNSDGSATAQNIQLNPR